MRHSLKVLKTVAAATLLVGMAHAQDVRDYTWRADVDNHGWKIGTPKNMGPGRPMRFTMQPKKWVTFTINRVAQLDNLDAGDALGADRADFYAMIWVDGQVYRSKNFSHDDGDPNWVLRVPVFSDSSQIRMALYDDDGGLEKRDDHVDINPSGHMKDLIFTLNGSGQISGDITGATNYWFTSRGGGDDDRGRITFQIS